MIKEVQGRAIAWLETLGMDTEKLRFIHITLTQPSSRLDTSKGSRGIEIQDAEHLTRLFGRPFVKAVIDIPAHGLPTVLVQYILREEMLEEILASLKEQKSESQIEQG